MPYNLKALFAGQANTLPVEEIIDFSHVEFFGERPFPHPAHVSGTFRFADGIVTLRAEITLTRNTCCARCLRCLEFEHLVDVDYIVISGTDDGGEHPNIAFVDGYELNLTDLLTNDLILSLPSKTLCGEQCKGLCKQCGTNLNEGQCSCKTDTVDPRLEVLKTLLD